MYEITKTFTAGTLKGITVTEQSTVKLEVGFECKKPAGGSSYIVTACFKIA